ncbi:MAG: hypothetical protein FJ100_08280 [Deltaproteobacteria bacterium]|nr:hypothetical protein [Deltaproteobacteria bacterium]
MERSAHAAWWLLLGMNAALAVLGCTDPVHDTWKDDIVPLLETRCANAACHGSLPGKEHQLDPARWLTFPIDGAGRITDSAKALASVKAKVNSVEDPAYSTLLRKTLPVAQGGILHFQNAPFPSRSDPAYQKLAAWVATVKDGTEAKAATPLDANEALFAKNVYPFLMDRGCATATCHGSLMFGGAVFSAPAIPGTHKLPKAELRATYAEARRNIALWGDPLRSRLVAKILPLEIGGIAHKGGNDVFLAKESADGADPRKSATVQGMLQWIGAERQTQMQSLEPKATTQPPIVAVGGPVAPAGPFDQPPFLAGSDLYRLDPPYTGAAVNLTGSLHTAPADVRDPATSHDAQRVVFTLRKAAGEAPNLWTVGVDGAAPKQLTFFDGSGKDGSFQGAYLPVYGPNGGFVDASGKAPYERIYFSGVKHGDASDVLSVRNADLYALDTDGQNQEQLTWTVVPETAPWFLGTGEFNGTMAYTIRRSAEGGFKGVLFRFPVCHNHDHHIQPEAHPHFGMSEPEQVFWHLRELPEGRSVLTVQDEGNVWRGGPLCVLERQFAVEVPEGQEAAATVPAFRHALTYLTPDAARKGQSAGGLWRDPTPMPDGSIVAAHAVGPFDLSEPATAPHLRLVHVTLNEDRNASRPKIAQIKVLRDEAGLSWSQPVAAAVRAPEDAPHPRQWNQKDALATLVHSGVQVIEAVLAQLSPLKARVLRTDLAYVRAVVPLAVAGKVDASPVPAAETRHGWQNATKASATGRMPLFAAAEVPPAVDGSLAAHIPAKVPVRVVTLDADRKAVGALQHQWYAAAPGERFPVGIPPTSYNARCAGCHGALDGNPSTALQPATDFVTQASVTAALYADADRRKPKKLPTVDASFFVLVDFAKDVAPILANKCATAGCHTGAQAAAGLSLTNAKTTHFSDAYESLLGPGDKSAGGYKYVDALGYLARKSFLAEKILGKELDAAGKLTGPCPPPGSPALTEAERTTLLRWIEFGAAWQGAPLP